MNFSHYGCSTSDSAHTPTASTSKKARRSRIQRACASRLLPSLAPADSHSTGDSCRNQKIRCEDGAPDAPCARCVLKGTPCTFEERAKIRQPPRSYVESLEMRLEAMEVLLKKVSPTAGRDIEALGEKGSPIELAESGGSVEGSPLGGEKREEIEDEELDVLGDEVHELSIDKVPFVSLLAPDATLTPLP